jgi:mono/diheme cytochrome c family protein
MIENFENSLRILAGFCATFVLGGCAVSTVAPPVSPAMVAGSGGRSADQLNQGRALFAGRCTACHSADPVTAYSAAEWIRIVDDMADRSNLRPGEREALLAYIHAAQKVPISPPVR